MTQRQCFHRHVAATALLIQNRSHLPKALIGGANLLSSNHLQTLHADTPSTESSTRVLSQTVSNMIHSLSDEPLDALRLAGLPGEINIALVGHTDASVNDKYGAKGKAVRFRHRLAEAVASVAYAGLDLAHLNEPSSGAGLTRAYKMGP